MCALRKEMVVLLSVAAFSLLCVQLSAQSLKIEGVRVCQVDSAWANNSVNTVIFRKNSLVSYRDTQFISFYDKGMNVVLGKRKLGSDSWILKRTRYQGNPADAHNTISIMVDGRGYLHLCWNHHNSPLNYCRSLQPGSLDMGDKQPMTGRAENSVSYPEFQRLPNGNLLFLYRDGGSGRGNLVLNAYDAETKRWTQLHRNLIDGEGKRNAYWQACTDDRGGIHISWVWRETPDVETNHDLCYARSTDGGITWQKSTGEKYQLPINATTAEYACLIPQQSVLINQTSMFVDTKGIPYIASYWKDAASAVPQYHIVYKNRDHWEVQNLQFRKTDFDLKGGGTKRIPISRPQIVGWHSAKGQALMLIFRDEERGNRVSIAICEKLPAKKWKLFDLTAGPVGSWEPSFDTELWRQKQVLNLFVENVKQEDAEGRANGPPQMVQVLEPRITRMK